MVEKLGENNEHCDSCSIDALAKRHAEVCKEFEEYVDRNESKSKVLEESQRNLSKITFERDTLKTQVEEQIVKLKKLRANRDRMRCELVEARSNSTNMEARDQVIRELNCRVLDLKEKLKAQSKPNEQWPEGVIVVDKDEIVGDREGLYWIWFNDGEPDGGEPHFKCKDYKFYDNKVYKLAKVKRPPYPQPIK
jgi:septal ring factor EnvC (AmiA/AmiB activator)